MKTQQNGLTPRAQTLTRVADRLVARTLVSLKEVNKRQQALLEQKYQETENNRKEISRRIELASRGARRLLSFANRHDVQRIVFSSKLLTGKDGIEFLRFEWSFIESSNGMRPLNRFTIDLRGEGISFSVEEHGENPNPRRFPGDNDGLKDFITAIARSKIDLKKVPVSDDLILWDQVFFQHLVSWARKDTFERVVDAFVARLECQIK